MAVLKITQEAINQYLTRFEGTTPLRIYPRGLVTRKFELNFVESEICLRSGLYQIQHIESNRQYKIIAGFTRTKLEEFIHFDWLKSAGEMPMLFNKRLVSKIKQVCPNDFTALPVTIINLSDQVDPYKNNDFYIVNALNTLDSIDKKRSVIDEFQNDVKKRIYKENPWQGHLIAFDQSIRRMIFHPTLAKALYPSKQFDFLTPEEDSFYHRGGYPDGHNKETLSYWINGIVKTMAYPRPSVLKLAAKQHPWIIPS
jgi:hypothetical protein